MLSQDGSLISLIKRNCTQNYLRKIRIVINAGDASPAAPLGPILGQNRIKIKPFCDDFNNLTKKIKPEFLPLNVEIKVLEDSTNFIEIKGVPLSFLIGCGIDKGEVKLSYLYKILIFFKSYSNLKKRSIWKSILGSVRSGKLSIINDI